MMNEFANGNEQLLFPKPVGERLRDARVIAKLDLADIAARTRIPLRHLEAIEVGDYSNLPSPTYATGFAKAYARIVGLDEAALGHDLRAELGQSPRPTDYQVHEAPDPARMPPKFLAITGVVIALLVMAAFGFWYSTRDAGPDAPVATAAGENGAEIPIDGGLGDAPEPAAPAGQAIASDGQVVLTATDDVWVRIYDGAGETLFEKVMVANERYEVPGNANNPQINVGRPGVMKVTVNGSEVAPLGPPELAIKDIGVSAGALAARPRTRGGDTRGLP